MCGGVRGERCFFRAVWNALWRDLYTESGAKGHTECSVCGKGVDTGLQQRPTFLISFLGVVLEAGAHQRLTPDSVLIKFTQRTELAALTAPLIEQTPHMMQLLDTVAQQCLTPDSVLIKFTQRTELAALPATLMEQTPHMMQLLDARAQQRLILFWSALYRSREEQLAGLLAATGQLLQLPSGSALLREQAAALLLSNDPVASSALTNLEPQAARTLFETCRWVQGVVHAAASLPLESEM